MGIKVPLPTAGEGGFACGVFGGKYEKGDRKKRKNVNRKKGRGKTKEKFKGQINTNLVKIKANIGE